MSAEPPPDTAREHGRAPVLSASMLRRIQARCVTRAHRYRRNHPGFSSRDERYFFFGARAVLETFPDPAAKAQAKEWLRDLFSTDHPPCDQSPGTQAARVREAEKAAERAAMLREMSASLDAQLARLTPEMRAALEADLAAMDARAVAGKDGAK